MVQIMHFVLLNGTKAPFSGITFIVVNVDDLTPIDNPNGFQSIFMWSKIERGSPSSFVLIKLVSLPHLTTLDGLGLAKMGGKLVSMCRDGSSVFQDHPTSVTLQFK
jgi:hypothetical protein